MGIGVGAGVALFVGMTSPTKSVVPVFGSTPIGVAGSSVGDGVPTDGGLLIAVSPRISNIVWSLKISEVS